MPRPTRSPISPLCLLPPTASASPCHAPPSRPPEPGSATTAPPEPIGSPPGAHQEPTMSKPCIWLPTMHVAACRTAPPPPPPPPSPQPPVPPPQRPPLPPPPPPEAFCPSGFGLPSAALLQDCPKAYLGLYAQLRWHPGLSPHSACALAVWGTWPSRSLQMRTAWNSSPSSPQWGSLRP